MEQVKIFISYRHFNKEWVLPSVAESAAGPNENQTFVSYLKERLDGIADIWFDNRLIAGDEYDQIITQNILESDIALLLISDYFPYSQYIMDIELPLMESVNIKTIPIIIESICDISFEKTKNVVDFSNSFPRDIKSSLSTLYNYDRAQYNDEKVAIINYIASIIPLYLEDKTLYKKIRNSVDNETLISEYIDKFPNGRYLHKVVAIRDSINDKKAEEDAYKKILMNESITLCDDFLDLYINSAYYTLVISRKAEIIKILQQKEEQQFNNLEMDDPIEIRNFISSFPKSQHKARLLETINKLEKSHYEKLKNETCIENLEMYVKNFPNSNKTGGIKERIEQQKKIRQTNARNSFRSAQKADTIEKYQKYIDKYSDGVNVDKAKARIEEIVRNSKVSYKIGKFIKKYWIYAAIIAITIGSLWCYKIAVYNKSLPELDSGDDYIKLELKFTNPNYASYPGEFLGLYIRKASSFPFETDSTTTDPDVIDAARLAKGNKTQEALRAYNSANESTFSSTTMYNIAIINSKLGNHSESDKWLERAVQNGHPVALFIQATQKYSGRSIRNSPPTVEELREVIPKLEQISKEKYPPALYALANAYIAQGNSSKAIEKYIEAAKLGCANSATAAAKIYLNNMDSLNYFNMLKMAVKYPAPKYYNAYYNDFERAMATVRLACCYYNGYNCKPDHTESYKILHQLEKENYSSTNIYKELLFIMYYNGDGVEQNQLHAYELAESVYKDGDNINYKNIKFAYYKAIMLMEGIGVDADIDRAKEILKSLTEIDPTAYWFNIYTISNSYYALGVMHKTERYRCRDVNKAISFLEQAADKGNKMAKNTLGCLYLSLNNDKGGDFALKYLNEAADSTFNNPSSIEALYNIGIIYQYGLYGIEPDNENALKYLKNAASKGHAIAKEITHMITSKNDINSVVR